MLPLNEKPKGNERVQLAFKAPTYLGCTEARVCEAVNKRVKESVFWAVSAPAIQSYRADVAGERDVQYATVTVQMNSFSRNSNWEIILKSVREFSGGFFCWGTDFSGITLADAKVIVDGTAPPPLAKQIADSVTEHSGDTREAAGVGGFADRLLGTGEAGFDALKWLSIAAVVAGGIYVGHVTGLLRFRR